MRYATVVCLLIFNMTTGTIGPLPAQDQTADSRKRSQFNQVFVKVMIPVTKHTPMQEGPAIESWIAKQLKQMKAKKCFAVTQWVPVCDGLLADDVIDNDVWDGVLKSKHSYCPVGGDIPERSRGRLKVLLGGWHPGGKDATISLADEPGSRAVTKVQDFGTKEAIGYVAVFVAPPLERTDVKVDSSK